MAAMAAGSRSDPELGRALLERWVGPRRDWGRQRLTRAARDGECRPGVVVDAALEALYGPLYARLLLGMGVPEPAGVDAYLAVVLDGVFGPEA